MAILKVYKNRVLNSNYITAKGKQINFVNGVYATAIEEEIAELDAEAKSGNPHIYIDENEKEVDSNALTPVQILEQKIRQKILAEMATATDKSNDMGSTVNTGKLEGIANSDTVGAAMAGSDSSNAGGAPSDATGAPTATPAAPNGLAALKALVAG